MATEGQHSDKVNESSSGDGNREAVSEIHRHGDLGQASVSDSQAAVSKVSADQATGKMYKLYSVWSIVVASLLGSFIGACVVMAINYRRLGLPGAASWSIVGGILATAAIGTVALILPEDFPSAPFHLLTVLVVGGIGQGLMSEFIQRHQRSGGEMESAWSAAGIGLICMVALLIVVFVVAGVTILIIEASAPDEFAKFGTRVAIGDSAIYYSGEATESDARELGRILKKIGELRGSEGATVLLSKSSAGFSVSCVVNYGVWHNTEAINYFREMGEKILSEGFGSPLTINLCDEHGQTKKTIPVSDSGSGE